MPRHQHVDLDFQSYDGPSDRSTDAFVYENKLTPIAWPLGKLPKQSEGRQRHFERQLNRLSSQLGQKCIPVHIEWRNGLRNQMDKGCIGHSFGRETAIESVAINHLNEVTHVVLRGNDAQD